MHRSFRGILPAVILLGVALPGRADAPKPSCGEYGTTVNFEESPSAAARKALKEEKLVVVLHISGHFEDPDFT